MWEGWAWSWGKSSILECLPCEIRVPLSSITKNSQCTKQVKNKQKPIKIETKENLNSLQRWYTDDKYMKDAWAHGLAHTENKHQKIHTCIPLIGCIPLGNCNMHWDSSTHSMDWNFNKITASVAESMLQNFFPQRWGGWEWFSHSERRLNTSLQNYTKIQKSIIWCLPNGAENLCPLWNWYLNIYSMSTQHCQTLEGTNMSTQAVIQLHSGILQI